MSNTHEATQEIVAVFKQMYMEELLPNDTFDAIAKASLEEDPAIEAKTVEPMGTRKRKLEQEGMTTEEAVMLALAASQYYTNQHTDGDYELLALSGTFGLNVYKKARDVLKPKYKELFDVKAIAKRFKKLADNA